MKPRNKRISPKHYGLLHGPMRVEVDDVTARHKKPCGGCGKLPEGRRLKITEGGGRAQSISVYCSGCGTAWLDDHVTELVRTIRRLGGADLCIRLITSDDN